MQSVAGYNQIPPNSTGPKLLTRVETIAAAQYHIQQVQIRGSYGAVFNTGAITLQGTNALWAISNETGSGFDIAIIDVRINNRKAAGYAGAIAAFNMGYGGGTLAGTQVFWRKLSSYGTQPTQAQVQCLTPVTGAGSYNVAREFYLHTASMEQAAAIPSAGIWNRNLMDYPPNMLPILIAEGQHFQASASVADASASVSFSVTIGVIPT